MAFHWHPHSFGVGCNPMKDQGFIVLYLIVALLLVGALGTIAYKLDSRGFERGKAQVEAQVAKRDNKALLEALDKLKLAQDRVRKLEDQNKTDLALAAENLKKGLDNAEKDKNAALAGVRDGAIKLRIQLANCTSNSVRNSTGAAVSGGQHDNATTTGELSREASDFLIGEASRADKNTKQLAACQKVLIKDREATK